MGAAESSLGRQLLRARQRGHRAKRAATALSTSTGRTKSPFLMYQRPFPLGLRPRSRMNFHRPYIDSSSCFHSASSDRENADVPPATLGPQIFYLCLCVDQVPLSEGRLDEGGSGHGSPRAPNVGMKLLARDVPTAAVASRNNPNVWLQASRCPMSADTGNEDGSVPAGSLSTTFPTNPWSFMGSAAVRAASSVNRMHRPQSVGNPIAHQRSHAAIVVTATDENPSSPR